MKNSIKSDLWQLLATEHERLKNTPVTDLFQNNPNRFAEFSIRNSGILLDFSRHRITGETLSLLSDLAVTLEFSKKFHAQCNAEIVNFTENRPALHTALRSNSKTPLLVQGENVRDAIHKERQRLLDFADAVIEGQFLGCQGQPITDVVNIGIGGSHLGPLMATTALKPYARRPLHFHFLSGIDKAPLNALMETIRPETTLFIVSSKSFSTLETLTNAQTLRAWLQATGHHEVLEKQWIAVTAAPEKARQFGFSDNRLFKTFEWVGGRYSLWSCIGLPLALMLGSQSFLDFLGGAASMDEHALTAPPTQNMPMVLALLTAYHLLLDDAQAEAIAPYGQRLALLIPYLQQALMESVGKSTTVHGTPVSQHTGPVLFGQEGCEGQHAYHQLLHQGTLCIPVDFILTARAHPKEAGLHHEALLASALSQAEALMRGLSLAEVRHNHPELTEAAALHRVLPGSRPANILILDELSPACLGALIALYEHKIYALSLIFDVNAFDQWGVELGKQLLPNLLAQLQSPLSPDEPRSLLTELKKRMQGMT